MVFDKRIYFQDICSHIDEIIFNCPNLTMG